MPATTATSKRDPGAADTMTIPVHHLEELAAALTAFRDGDFRVRLGRREGLLGELADRFNDVAGLQERRTRELVRVSHVIGREGRMTERLGELADQGGWASSAHAVNSMIDDLVRPTTEVARVIDAVARGDLSQHMALEITGQPVKGEFERIGATVNRMVDQLSSFADEVTRVAREVGTEGKLGGQAQVRGVSGVWRDLTGNVNSMAANLTTQVRNIAQVTTAVAQGDLSQKITVDARGEILELKNTVNTMVDQLSSFADEVTRVAREVGTEGRLGGQAEVRGVSGTWRDLTHSVNSMAVNLTDQVRNIAQVATEVARGDLSQKITVEAKGEVAALADTMNAMVDQLSSFAAEVTRVAREVGTEGRLGGQAEVAGVAGTWKDLTDAVNSMAGNLTSQVRNIAQVTTAVAQGDLSQKITVGAEGEILELKNTVNTMVDQLSSFAAEVTRVAREVGTEGQLGGQAEVAGVSGTWRDLTENVNQLAGNLTTQVRAIAEVSTAVTRGDLTRSIAVQAQGEVAELKDNINQMIANLRETTEKNAQTDWLRSNLARIGGRMQGQRDLQALCTMLISEISPVVSAQQGAFFLLGASRGGRVLRLASGYAFTGDDVVFQLGEGLVGQAALERRRLRVQGAPAGYLTIRGGLGQAPPVDVLVLPVLFEEQVLGIIELASFHPFSAQHLIFLDQLLETIGVVLNTIIANTRTEELLTQSQRLTQELQVQSDELQRTNAELKEKAHLLTEQSRDLEAKNHEIELARLGLEEKALQLELASQYKSEFLANMSHELRTPLNSLLILARLLSDNPERNLTNKQIEFARTIHRAGSDLLELINDILDLSKVEAGKMDVHTTNLDVRGLCEAVEATFRPIAEQKGLSFLVRVDPGVGDALVTDEQRLRQVLRNLLSNAFKFTDAGHVTLQASLARPALRLGVPTLDNAPRPPLVFAVSDTGIGVAPGKLRHIFEAFQQADGTTSRKFGGTGLGLSISRQIARLLGGAITVESEEGAGSTFSLYLPQDFPFADTVQFPEPAAAGAAGQRSGTPIIVPSPSLPSPSLPSPSLPSPSAPWPALPEPPGTPWPGTPVAPAAVLDRTTVLVVDDDVRNVFALTSALELHGARVLYADAGADGLRLLREHPEVALVLMDVMMPDMDGNETTAAIRRMPGREHLPVLFLTAKAMPGDREKSLAAGASGYITKPVDLDILLRSMLHLLEQPATGADGSPRDPGANAASRPAADDPAADGRAADGRAGDAP